MSVLWFVKYIFRSNMGYEKTGYSFSKPFLDDLHSLNMIGQNQIVTTFIENITYLPTSTGLLGIITRFLMAASGRLCQLLAQYTLTFVNSLGAVLILSSKTSPPTLT